MLLDADGLALTAGVEQLVAAVARRARQARAHAVSDRAGDLAARDRRRRGGRAAGSQRARRPRGRAARPAGRRGRYASVLAARIPAIHRARSLSRACCRPPLSPAPRGLLRDARARRRGRPGQGPGRDRGDAARSPAPARPLHVEPLLARRAHGTALDADRRLPVASPQRPSAGVRMLRGLRVCRRATHARPGAPRPLLPVVGHEAAPALRDRGGPDSRHTAVCRRQRGAGRNRAGARAALRPPLRPGRALRECRSLRRGREPLAGCAARAPRAPRRSPLRTRTCRRAGPSRRCSTGSPTMRSRSARPARSTVWRPSTQQGTSADRQLALHRDGESLRAIVQSLVDETRS